jgi:hypothetical protein
MNWLVYLACLSPWSSFKVKDFTEVKRRWGRGDYFHDCWPKGVPTGWMPLANRTGGSGAQEVTRGDEEYGRIFPHPVLLPSQREKGITSGIFWWDSPAARFPSVVVSLRKLGSGEHELVFSNAA